MQKTLPGAFFVLRRVGLDKLNLAHSEMIQDSVQGFFGSFKQIKDQGGWQVVLSEFAIPERELQQIRLPWLQVGDQVFHALFR